MPHLNYLAILLAPLVGFPLGFLWYGFLFGKPWMRAVGLTEEKCREANMGRIYGTTYVLNLLAAFGLALLIAHTAVPEHRETTISGPNLQATITTSDAAPATGKSCPLCGFCIGLIVGLACVSTAYGVSYLFERRPLNLWLINSGYQIILFSLMGLILGAWR